jgi:hypothetical protein
MVSGVMRSLKGWKADKYQVRSRALRAADVATARVAPRASAIPPSARDASSSSSSSSSS